MKTEPFVKLLISWDGCNFSPVDIPESQIVTFFHMINYPDQYQNRMFLVQRRVQDMMGNWIKAREKELIDTTKIVRVKYL